MESNSDNDSQNDNKEKIKNKDKENKDDERDEKFDFLRVVKEKQKFPCNFTKFIQLKKIINYYDKNWGEGLSDEDEENDGDDESDKVKKI